MNAKAAEAWNFALAKMQTARSYIDTGQDGLAKTEVAAAVYVGAGALYYLLGRGRQEREAYGAAQAFIANMAENPCSASQAYQAARQVLNSIAAMSPSEDKLPPV